ncbi:sulfatase-like hydrolase/transferase [Halopenitus sp. H-Gu1]|uniref:sulfatase-like hydrolase/transferase n=1 Tax=Halopenitus sp. H-Gu1 TaxID=3242697 RepID=UPI00359D7961
MSRKIRNCYVFVADALRWDYLPDSIRSQGAVRKTVAASTLSPTSFASLTSGLYPPEHGVYTFGHRVKEGQNWLLETEAVDVSFWQSIDEDPIYEVLGQDPITSQRVDEMDTPFINIERELVTHSPYGLTGDEQGDYSAVEFLNDYTDSLDELRAGYFEGAKRATEIFTKRLDSLEECGLLDETLVIFTSDHGELLGEYGSLSHVYPVVPELVYVPTVVIDPRGQDVRESLFSHVDIPATIADVLNIDPPYETPGKSAFEAGEREHAYAGFEFPPGYSAFGRSESRLNRHEHSVHSLWDADGGWVFDDSPRRSRLHGAVKHVIPTTPRARNVLKQNPRGLLSLLRQIFRARKQFGKPDFDQDEARRLIDDLKKRGDRAAQQDELGANQLKQLKNLGYLE